jgi:AAA+ superfamily predicted ATPase
MNTESFLERLELLIRSRYPLIWIATPEEERIRGLLDHLAEKLGKKAWYWDGLDGGSVRGTRLQATERPDAALDQIRASGENGIFVLLDFHHYLKPENHRIIRRLRTLAFDLKRSFKTLIIVSPGAEIPPELEKEISILDLPLPTPAELLVLLRRVLASVEKVSGLSVDATPELLERVARAAGGLTMAEAENVYYKAAVSGRKFNEEDLSLVLEEKRQVLRKTGVLEYFESAERMHDVGGLANLKKWLADRDRAFTDKAREFGLPQPKGLLLLGVQGCGKSLMAKAVAQYWQLPLLRLDIGSLFSMYIGSTEANMRRAIGTAETLAPVVLWLDEIEKGLSGLQSSGAVDAGVTARIFASFLLWMQEKRAPVFVVATANDVSQLPPELLRKGRFDEIFFVDLPSEAERRDIFAIHLARRRRKPENFDLARLAGATEGFSGAEIESVIVNGLYAAFAAGRELQQTDLDTAARTMIPLSRTMEHRIGELREWARTRTLPAS